MTICTCKVTGIEVPIENAYVLYGHQAARLLRKRKSQVALLEKLFANFGKAERVERRDAEGKKFTKLMAKVLCKAVVDIYLNDLETNEEVFIPLQRWLDLVKERKRRNREYKEGKDAST